MKKNLLLVALPWSVLGYGQVGINTDTPKATFDVVATAADPTVVDGIIAPRLTGNELKAKDDIYNADQIGTLIYATAAAAPISPKTINVTTAGYYYFDGSVWVKFSPASAAQIEPWNVQGSTTPATDNIQDIYQSGSVAVGKNAVLSGANLDVDGAVRAGQLHTGTVGVNSAAFGENNTVSGESAMAFGLENQVTQFVSGAIGFANLVTQEYAMAFGQSNKVLIGAGGYGSAAFGQSNTISGSNSHVSGVGNNVSGSSATAFGQSNTVTANFSQSFGYANRVDGTGSTAFGQENRTLGTISAVFGVSNIAASPGELVLGQNNGIITSSVPSNASNGAGIVLGAPSDPIFQIGNGNETRNNAVTVLNNGSMGIGITGAEAAAKPTEKLDIGSGNVRIRDINSNTGSGGTDKVVVADATGVLKTIDFKAYTLFHARLAGSQNGTSGIVLPLVFSTPLSTSTYYSYNTSNGVMTFNEAGNYLITLQASFTNIPANTQLVLGIRPFPDSNYIGRASHYNAGVNSLNIGELMNYTTVIVVPSSGYQVRFTATATTDFSVLATEAGATGSGNVTNVTIQKI
ncbi:hypothetical protein [Chryseobacterium sp. FH1]|uniref:hypothetical protein n=1 Tax=Chryseobacterium sp. FH1 TaxID=1233951 RepID=UPI0004E44C7A|nr:hypothetical protein [Chryseobacterium sp. FH1]KFC20040.1 hypothetical protein IO90_12580 [Chryseobacterium sp. FH1]